MNKLTDELQGLSHEELLDAFEEGLIYYRDGASKEQRKWGNKQQLEARLKILAALKAADELAEAVEKSGYYLVDDRVEDALASYTAIREDGK